MKRAIPMLLWTACSTPAFDDVALTLTLPLAAADIDFVEVTAHQGDEVVRAVPDPSGTVHLRLRAGADATLAAAVFSIADNRWLSFEGGMVLTPRAGSQSLVLELWPVRARRGVLAPYFDDGVNVYEYTGSLPVAVRDEATGFHKVAAFTAPDPMEVPQTRVATYIIMRPDTGERVSFALDDTFEDAKPVPLGQPPALPAAPTIATMLDTADLSAIQGAPGYTLQCAVGSSCAGDLNWQPCDSAFILEPVGVEENFSISVRYAEVATLCTVIAVTRDRTPPALALEINPAFLRGSPQSVLLTVASPEELLSVTADGGPSVACAGFNGTVTPSGFAYNCNLSLSSAGSKILRVIATDLAGNTTQASATLPDVGSSPTGLAVVGSRTFPAPANILSPFLLGVDVVNLGPGLACATLEQVTFVHRATGTVVPELSAPPSGPTRLDLGVNEAATLWTQVQVAAPDLSAGEHDVQAVVNWSDCAFGAPVPTSGVHVVTLVQEPLHWLGGRLVMGLPSQLAKTMSSLWDSSLPLAGGAFPGNRNLSVTATPQGIVDAAVGDGVALNARALGEAQVTAQELRPGAQKATITVEVAPGPDRLILQASRVTRISDTGDTAWPVDPAVGTPRRLLWESSRDEVVVVGSAGLTSALGARATPCGQVGATIIDATLAAFGPGTGRVHPRVAMLVQDGLGFHHCELDLVDGTALSQLMPPHCATYLQLAGDGRSGAFLALGDEGAGIFCAASYNPATSPPVLSITSGLSSATAGASLDPFGNFASFVVYGFPQTVAGVGLGTELAAAPAYELNPSGQYNSIYAYATAIDPLGRGVFVSASGQSFAGTSEAILLRFDHRYALGPISDQGSLPLGFGVGFTKLAVDPAERVIVATDNAQPPRLWTLGTDYLGQLSQGVFDVRAVGANDPVIDLVIAGPQPVSLTPRHAAPGGLVTVMGSGFQGNDSDEVMVQGIAAQTVRSSPTAVTFRVPSTFAARLAPMLTEVTVRAHGRLSGPTPFGLQVVPPAPTRLLAGGRVTSDACSTPPCQPASLVDSPRGIYSFHRGGSDPATLLSWFGLPNPYFAVNPEGVALLPGATRVAGFFGGAQSFWIDFPLPDPLRAGIVESERLMTLPGAAGARVGPLAADPTGRYLALAVNNEVHLFAANALTPVQAGKLPAAAATPRAITFSPDGQVVAVFHDPANVAVHALPPPAASLSFATPCAVPSPRLIGAWTRYAPTSEIVALYHDLGSGRFALVALAAADGFAPSCRAQRDLGITNPGVATLSALGDALLLTDLAGRAWVLSPDDLRVFHRRDNVSTLAEGVLLTSGNIWASFPEALIADPSLVEAIQTLPAYGWSESGL